MRKLTVFAGIISALALQGSVFATGYNSELNHPQYWGDNCYKIEISGDQLTYTVTDSNATKVIVKGGTTNKIYQNGPFENLTAQINPNNNKPYGISHVIICADVLDGGGGVGGGDDVITDTDATNDQNGVVDDQAEVSAVSGKTAVKELPKTGAPVVVNLLLGSSISTLAGWIATKRR